MSNDKAQATYNPNPISTPEQMRTARRLQRDGWVFQTTMSDGTMVFYRKQWIKKRWVIFWSIMTFGIGVLYFAFAAANRRTDSCLVALDGSVA